MAGAVLAAPPAAAVPAQAAPAHAPAFLHGVASTYRRPRFGKPAGLSLLDLRRSAPSRCRPATTPTVR
ncbi:hypothetical protein GCM10010145_41370 [Streptomyces ruber]|uniref:Uncharacterized protein n=2 Tax=Streptomyces TaxID=1883 RepID=A0A918BGE6_9ACTN|nr:hypothetical protein GCM10010145_41370 [Streptomyces ruber]